MAMLHGKRWTVFGWTRPDEHQPHPPCLRNFLTQGNGSKMLRLICCLLGEAGVTVCAPVHGAMLIETPLESLPEVVRETQQIMSDASAIVLDGFRLRSDAEVFLPRDRCMDERGRQMWQAVTRIIDQAEGV
jgi:hypothetical protein